jgi:peptidoglycan/xylan/chitin deacetylase (PgdA/CDA1 family)
MKKFYLITGVLVAAMVVLLLLPVTGTVLWTAGGVLVLAWLAALAIGASFIGSQMFVRTVCRGGQEQGTIALTFDDGPDPVKTARILDMLEENGCRASFFLIGGKMKNNAGLVRRMAENGHTIGIHSFSHSSLFPVMSGSRIRDEILASKSLVKEITGREAKFFRPPFGVTNPRIFRGLKGTAMVVAGWSIRSMDTRGEEATKVVNRIMRKAGRGEIILLHDTSPHILEILELLLPAIREKRLQCEGLDGMVGLG